MSRQFESQRSISSIVSQIHIDICYFLFDIMLTLNSRTTMDELDLNITEDILLMRTSRTATFTLNSSASYSNTFVSQRRQSFIHRQTISINKQKRRPTIHDPYELISNLHTLNDWMIVSFFLLLLLFFCGFSNEKYLIS